MHQNLIFIDHVKNIVKKINKNDKNDHIHLY